MARTGVVLSNTSFLAASSVGTAQTWHGGRAVISITADQYGGAVFLQSMGPANSKWIAVNGTTYSADQVTAYDIPAGQVRIVSASGSSINLQAKLLPVSYGG